MDDHRKGMPGSFDEVMKMDQKKRMSLFQPADRATRIVVAIIAIVFLLMCALTSALPNPAELNPTDPASLAALAMVNSGDTAWMLTSSALVLFMTPGVAFFYGGMVNHKNVISTMYQSFVAMGLVSCLWTIVGFSLAFGKDANGSGIFGYPSTYYMYNDVGILPNAGLCPTVPLTVFSMFQLMFAIITPTLISGSIAERVNFSAWMLIVCFWHLLVYCPIAHMMWHPDGIFHKWGAIDFAGGTVVEMNSGFAALAGAVFLGPRKRIHHTPANIPFIMLGTGIFWFGWMGFNAGSAISSGGLASQAFCTTNTAGASAMMMWILLDFITGKPTSAVGACNGIVIGLVAITPGCGYVTVGSAMVIGALACIVCYGVGIFMKQRTNIDDTLDVFTVHGIGGLVGFLCTGIFASKNANASGAPDGLIYGQGMTLAKHIAIVLVLLPCIFISTYLIFFIVNLFVPVRVSSEEEDSGLDESMHQESYHSELKKDDASDELSKSIHKLVESLHSNGTGADFLRDNEGHVNNGHIELSVAANRDELA